MDHNPSRASLQEVVVSVFYDQLGQMRGREMAERDHRNERERESGR